VVVLLVVYYLMGTAYLKQHRENKTLASQIQEMTLMLAQVPVSPADLEQRLKAAENDFETTRTFFPERLNTTQVVNSILRLAENTGVKAIPLVTQPWSLENVGGYDYSVFRLDISVTGTFTKLVNFINQLETSELQTLIIESLSAERITDNPREEDTIPVGASLAIAIYARPSAADVTGKAE
jgi:hypothetical protein